MKLVVIADDDFVSVDGDARRVDCAQLRADGVHAVQWDGATGAIEVKAGAQQPIKNLNDFVGIVAAHAAKKNADALAQAAAEAAAGALPAPRDLVAELDALRLRVAALDGKG